MGQLHRNQQTGRLFVDANNITKLPPYLHVRGNLDVSFSYIGALSQGLVVDGDLNIRNSEFDEIPPGTRVGGLIDLSNTKITTLPESIDDRAAIATETGRVLAGEFLERVQ